MEKLKDKIERYINKTGVIRTPAYFIKDLFNDIVDFAFNFADNIYKSLDAKIEDNIYNIKELIPFFTKEDNTIEINIKPEFTDDVIANENGYKNDGIDKIFFNNVKSNKLSFKKGELANIKMSYVDIHSGSQQHWQYLQIPIEEFKINKLFNRSRDNNIWVMYNSIKSLHITDFRCLQNLNTFICDYLYINNQLVTDLNLIASNSYYYNTTISCNNLTSVNITGTDDINYVDIDFRYCKILQKAKIINAKCSISNCDNIKTIELKDSLFTSVANCSKLETLILNNCKISGCGVQNCGKLKVLNLTDCEITNPIALSAFENTYMEIYLPKTNNQIFSTNHSHYNVMEINIKCIHFNEENYFPNFDSPYYSVFVDDFTVNENNELIKIENDCLISEDTICLVKNNVDTIDNYSISDFALRHLKCETLIIKNPEKHTRLLNFENDYIKTINIETDETYDYGLIKVDNVLYNKSESGYTVLFCDKDATEVTLIDGTIEIYKNAFKDCKNLTKVDYLGENYINVGYQAFANCENLENLNIPLSATIEKTAFTNCNKLKYIKNCNININFDTIFKDCSNLQSINNSNVVYSSNTLYYVCNSVEEYIVPDNTVVEDSAFSNSTSLKKLYISKNVTFKSSYRKWFGYLGIIYNSNGFRKLEHIEFIDSSDYNSIDGIIYDKNGKLIYCPANKNIILTDDIKIDPYAFIYNNSETLTIPNIDNCSNYAFYKSNIKNVILEGGSIIPQYCFAYSQIENVHLNDSILEIRNDAFTNCDKLSNINLSSVKTISYNNFSKCLLSDVNLDSVESIGSKCFIYCANLQTVIIGDKLKNIGNYSFSSCDNLSDVQIRTKVFNERHRGSLFWESGKNGITIKVPKDSKNYYLLYSFSSDSGYGVYSNMILRFDKPLIIEYVDFEKTE